jgi:hypothetical protein
VPFKKGEGGRPHGAENKVTRDVRELARGLFDAAYWQKTKERLDAGKLNPVIEKTLLAYAFGEPKKTVKLEGSVDVKAKRAVLSNLPIETLRQLAAQAHFAAIEDTEDTPH